MLYVKNWSILLKVVKGDYMQQVAVIDGSQNNNCIIVGGQPVNSFLWDYYRRKICRELNTTRWKLGNIIENVIDLTLET